MGHCMFGSQLPKGRNKPHYLHITHRKHECFDILQSEKHAINIHTILLPRSDMSLPLIDRKPLGHKLTMNAGNRRIGCKNELVFKYSVCVCVCRLVPPFFH